MIFQVYKKILLLLLRYKQKRSVYTDKVIDTFYFISSLQIYVLQSISRVFKSVHVRHFCELKCNRHQRLSTTPKASSESSPPLDHPYPMQSI